MSETVRGRQQLRFNWPVNKYILTCNSDGKTITAGREID